MPKEVDVNSLPLDEPLTRTVFSSSGDMLLEEGVNFNQARLDAFTAIGITHVFIPNEEEAVDDCRYELRYQKTAVADIPPGAVLALSIFDDSSRLLIQEGAELSKSHSGVLSRQGVHHVYIKKQLDAETSNIVAKLRKSLNRIAVDEATTAFGEAFQNEKLDETRVFDGDMKAAIEAESHRKVKHDNDVRKLVEADRLTDVEDSENREALQNTRKDLFETLRGIFDDINKGKFSDGKEIGKFVHAVVEGLVSNRFHRLHIAEPDEDKYYLPSHSLNTAIIALNMAARMGFAMSEIFELGHGALLHDIGMMRINPDVVNKAEPLANQEWTEIRNHPALGLDMMQKIRGLPVTTPIVCYQENERLDGSGYPVGKSSTVLLSFTRIVSVAAAYDAMTRTRPYREAMGAYDAITELLQEVHHSKMDTNCVRALLETLSLFPICSGIELDDGRIGYVLDTVGNNYTRPVVAIEYDADGRAYDSELIVDMQKPANQNIRIVRAIPQYVRRINGGTFPAKASSSEE